jgi:hypothetical protein
MTTTTCSIRPRSPRQVGICGEMFAPRLTYPVWPLPNLPGPYPVTDGGCRSHLSGNMSITTASAPICSASQCPLRHRCAFLPPVLPRNHVTRFGPRPTEVIVTQLARPNRIVRQVLRVVVLPEYRCDAFLVNCFFRLAGQDLSGAAISRISPWLK